MEQQKAGNTKPEFLLDYAYYAASRYNRTESEKCAEQLITMPGYSLENPKVWALFVKSIHGRDNKLFKMLCSDIDKYRKIHGTQAVDSKLFKECNYCPDAAELAAIPDFEGKTFLTRKNEADRLISAEKYEEAARLIDQMVADPGAFRELIKIIRNSGKKNAWNIRGIWLTICLTGMTQLPISIMPTNWNTSSGPTRKFRNICPSSSKISPNTASKNIQCVPKN